MDMKTGAIAQFENELDARAAGYLKQLSEDQAKQLLPLPREERISVVRQITIEDRRQRKQKRKAQRAARRENRR